MVLFYFQPSLNGIYKCEGLNGQKRYPVKAVPCLLNPCVGSKHIKIEIDQYISNHDQVQTIELLKYNNSLFKIFGNYEKISGRATSSIQEYLSNEQPPKLIVPVVNTDDQLFTINIVYKNYAKKQYNVKIQPKLCTIEVDISKSTMATAAELVGVRNTITAAGPADARKPITAAGADDVPRKPRGLHNVGRSPTTLKKAPLPLLVLLICPVIFCMLVKFHHRNFRNSIKSCCSRFNYSS